MSEQTTCKLLSHENVAWAGIPQTTHCGSYQLLASPAKELKEVFDAGEHVIVVLHETATMRDTGIPLERDLAQL